MFTQNFDTEKLLYIQIPESLERNLGEFQIRSDVPLPIEKDSEGKEPDLNALSWEMIVSAMLKIMGYQRDHKDFKYYQQFILAVKPNIISELSSTGIIKAQSGDYGLALEIFLAMEGLDDNLAMAKINIALVLEQMAKKLAEKSLLEEAAAYKAGAREKYITVLDYDPPVPEAFLNAGMFYLRDNDYDRAVSLLESFLEISDDEEKKLSVEEVLAKARSQNNLDTLFKEAYDFIVLGKEENGIKKIQDFLEVYPNIWNGWFLLGWAKRRLEDFIGAKESFTKALETGGEEQVDLLNELAICEMELNNLLEAKKYLENALRLEPENTKIISNLGILELKKGNQELAEGFFRTVQEIDPDDPVVKQYLTD